LCLRFFLASAPGTRVSAPAAAAAAPVPINRRLVRRSCPTPVTAPILPALSAGRAA
jgi:hypothetical protein